MPGVSHALNGYATRCEWAYETSVGDLDARRFWRNYNGIKRTMAVGPLYQTHHAVGDRPVRETEELDPSR
jgi:hypothetical protein